MGVNARYIGYAEMVVNKVFSSYKADGPQLNETMGWLLQAVSSSYYQQSLSSDCHTSGEGIMDLDNGLQAMLQPRTTIGVGIG